MINLQAKRKTLKEVVKWIGSLLIIYPQNFLLYKTFIHIGFDHNIAWWSWILIAPLTYLEWKFIEKKF